MADNCIIPERGVKRGTEQTLAPKEIFPKRRKKDLPDEQLPDHLCGEIVDVIALYTKRCHVPMFAALALHTENLWRGWRRGRRKVLSGLIREGHTEVFKKTYRSMCSISLFFPLAVNDLLVECAKAGARSLGIARFLVDEGSCSLYESFNNACRRGDVAAMEWFNDKIVNHPRLKHEYDICGVHPGAVLSAAASCNRAAIEWLVSGERHNVYNHPNFLPAFLRDDDEFIEYLIQLQETAQSSKSPYLQREMHAQFNEMGLEYAARRGNEILYKEFISTGAAHYLDSIRTAALFGRSNILELARVMCLGTEHELQAIWDETREKKLYNDDRKYECMFLQAWESVTASKRPYVRMMHGVEFLRDADMRMPLCFVYWSVLCHFPAGVREKKGTISTSSLVTDLLPIDAPFSGWNLFLERFKREASQRIDCRGVHNRDIVAERQLLVTIFHDLCAYGNGELYDAFLEIDQISDITHLRPFSYILAAQYQNVELLRHLQPTFTYLHKNVLLASAFHQVPDHLNTRAILRQLLNHGLRTDQVPLKTGLHRPSGWGPMLLILERSFRCLESRKRLLESGALQDLLSSAGARGWKLVATVLQRALETGFHNKTSFD